LNNFLLIVGIKSCVKRATHRNIEKIYLGMQKWFCQLGYVWIWWLYDKKFMLDLIFVLNGYRSIILFSTGLIWNFFVKAMKIIFGTAYMLTNDYNDMVLLCLGMNVWKYPSIHLCSIVYIEIDCIFYCHCRSWLETITQTWSLAPHNH